MLDQVIIAWPFASGSLHQLSSCVQLMKTGKDHRLPSDDALAPLSVILLFIFFLDEHEVPEDVQKAVCRQDFFPEKSGSITRGMLRVACPALDFSRVAAPIKGQEQGLHGRQEW